MTPVSLRGMFCPLGMVVKASIVSTFQRVAEAVKSFFLNSYAAVLSSSAFHSISTKCVSVVLVDRQYPAAKLKRDANRDYYQAVSHFLAKFVGQMLEQSFEQGPSMPKELRPAWLDTLVWQKPDKTFAYTFKGQIAYNIVCNNRELFERSIEHSCLKLFARLAERIQKVQSKNVFFSLEATQEILKLVTEHLLQCDGIEKSFKDDSVEDIAEVIHMGLSMALPKGADDLELPVREFLDPYIKPFLFSLIKDTLLPQVVREGLMQARSPYVKMLMLNEGLELVKTNLEQEHRTEVPPSVSSYPPEKLAQLEGVLNDCITASFDYLLRGYDTVLKSERAVEQIAKSSAVTMVEELPKIVLQQLVRTALVKLPTSLNEGGRWEVVDGKPIFVLSEFRFENQEKIRSEKIKFERERMVRLVETTGDDPKRLYQLLQSALFFTNKPNQKSSGGSLSSIFSFYGTVTKGVARVMVEQSSIQAFIRAINQSASQKLFYPEHDRLYLLLAKKVFTLLA